MHDWYIHINTTWLPKLSTIGVGSTDHWLYLAAQADKYESDVELTWLTALSKEKTFRMMGAMSIMLAPESYVLVFEIATTPNSSVPDVAKTADKFAGA